MKNEYTELLEQIVTEMEAAMGDDSTIIDSEYRQWLGFLKQIHPESVVLKNGHGQESALAQSSRADPIAHISPDQELRECSDLRELMQLAALHKHPTWYIQPHFAGSVLRLNYKNGEPEDVHDEIPSNIPGFSGTISGTWSDDNVPNPSFIAHDLANDMSFLEKMKFLKKAGFTTPDFVLFPTDKLPTVSSSKLETSLAHFISTAQASWAKVDGVVIVSDTPLFGGSNNAGSKRIIFKLNVLAL